MYQILTWSIMYCRRTREKFWSSKVGKNSLPLFFAEYQDLTLGKEVVCRVPTRWHSVNLDGRQRPLPDVAFCRAPGFAKCLTLGKKGLCRVPDTRQILLCRVYIVAECGTRQNSSLPSARLLALGKESCTRQRPCFP